MICIFFGHRDAPSKVKEPLKIEIEKLLIEGVKEFYVGNNGNFDYYAQSVLTELYNERKDFSFSVILSRISENAIYADQSYTLYPEGLENVPPRFAISKRNDIMIKKGKIAITFVKHSFSNSYKLQEKARKKGLRIINLAEAIEKTTIATLA